MKCPQMPSSKPLPPLMRDGITDYPKVGDNKEIAFKNSKYAVIPFEISEYIRLNFPRAWCKGGNYFGNDAYAYFEEVVKGKPSEKALRWMKKREQYIARHRKDFRLAGIIAMIKWAGYVDGPKGKGNGAETGSSLAFMLDVIFDYGR